MRLVCFAAATLSALAFSAAPAAADNDQQDRQFLSTMEGIGWSIYDPQGLISQANMVCNEGLAHGVNWREVRAQLIEWGYSVRDSSMLIANATFAYCPEYRWVADEIQADKLFRNSS